MIYLEKIRYEFYNDSGLVWAINSTDLNTTLGSGNFTHFDNITLNVTAWDGYNYSNNKSKSFPVLNHKH